MNVHLGLDLLPQLINLFAAIILLLSFAMLAQRRIVRLIHLFTLQGLALVGSTLVMAWVTAQPHLYWSAGLTLLLKVLAIPALFHHLLRRLDLRRDSEAVSHLPSRLLIGIVLVVLAFNLALPISQLSTTIARGTLGIALACVLLSFLMMITRSKAVPQVIGFLSMENALFFAATSATYGMPMVVELGIALDVLVGVFILGLFMFQIREQFDSLDISRLEDAADD